MFQFQVQQTCTSVKCAICNNIKCTRIIVTQITCPHKIYAPFLKYSKSINNLFVFKKKIVFFIACAVVVHVGIYRQNKLEYVVGTTMGHIECIQINIDDATDSLTLTTTIRPNPIYMSKCSLFGLATSTNNAFTLMTQYVNVVSAVAE